jgi:hypothetical protein
VNEVSFFLFMANHLVFHPIEIQHRPTLLPYLRKHSRTCDRTFTNEFCWQHHYGTRWTETNGWLVLRIHINGERRIAYIPLSQKENPQYDEIIPLLEEDADQNNQSLTLMSLNEEECDLIRKQCPDAFVFDRNRDFADYLYRAEDLRTLKGRKFAQKRNHVNKFKLLYSYHYEPITNKNIPDCLQLEEDWIAQHPHDESALAERSVIQLALNHFEELELIGGALYVEQQIIAFTYGSAINEEMFCTHVEKANIRFEGAYQMINQLFAQHLPDQYTLINREEDLGLEGLRKAKSSYEPFDMAYKASAVKITDEMRDIIRLWHIAFGETDLSVQTFLSRYYFEECALKEKVDGHVVSMAFMIPCHTPYGLGAYLYGIATLPDYQHQGLSSKLINRLLEKCKANGMAFSFLIPAEDSLVAYYNRFGYQTTETKPIFLCDMDLGTGDSEKDKILVLPLNETFLVKDLPETMSCTPML